MHDTALRTGELFFTIYLGQRSAASVLDVGSMDVNGSLRRFAPAGARYVGVDLASGPGVDIVLQDPHALPFEANAFDAVVSTSCFEHDPMFWLTFGEMARVTAEGGLIYVSAPSNGSYHRYPLDCWRFYPDAGLSLEAWGQRQGHGIRLLESFIARREGDIWNDCVMVFEKGLPGRAWPARIADHLPSAMNVHRSDRPGAVGNHAPATEDQEQVLMLQQRLRECEARIAELERQGAAA